jgi:hypothetical protein
MDEINTHYVHFDNEQLTDKFIEYLNTINVTISHKCCSGKGVGINTLDDIDINEFIDNFWNQIPKEKCVDINTIEICSVCYESTSYAINCHQPHFICNSCFEKIKECPICRRKLIK